MKAERRRLPQKDVGSSQTFAMKAEVIGSRAVERPQVRNGGPLASRRGRSGGSQDSPPDSTPLQVDHKARLVSQDGAEPGPGSLLVRLKVASRGPSAELSRRGRARESHRSMDKSLAQTTEAQETKGQQEKLTKKLAKKLGKAKGKSDRKWGELQATKTDPGSTRLASQSGEGSLGHADGPSGQAALRCQETSVKAEVNGLPEVRTEVGKTQSIEEDVMSGASGSPMQVDMLGNFEEEDLPMLQLKNTQAAGLLKVQCPGKELIKREVGQGKVLSQLGPGRSTPSSRAIKKDSSTTRRQKVKRSLPKEARAGAKKQPRFSERGASLNDEADGFSSDEDLKLSLVKGKASPQLPELHTKLSAEEDDLFEEFERTDDEGELEGELEVEGEDERLAREEEARAQEEERLKEEARMTEVERQREIERLKNLEWQKEEAKRRDEAKRRGEERWREERKRKDRERRKEQERLKEEARLKEEKKRAQEEKRLAEEREKAALEEAREEALRAEERAKISLQLSALQRIQATIEAAKEAKLALSEDGNASKQALSPKEEEVSAESVRDSKRKRAKPSSSASPERKLKTVRLSMLDIAAAAEEMSPRSRHSSPGLTKGDSPTFKRSQLSVEGGFLENERLASPWQHKGKQPRNMKSPRFREPSSGAEPLPPLISPREGDHSCSFELFGQANGRPCARKEPRFLPAEDLEVLDESDESEDDENVSATDVSMALRSLKRKTFAADVNDERGAPGGGKLRRSFHKGGVQAGLVKDPPEDPLRENGTLSDSEADWIVDEDSSQQSRDVELDQTKKRGNVLKLPEPCQSMGLRGDSGTMLLRPGQGMLVNTGVKAVC